MEISFENLYVDHGVERGNLLLLSCSQMSENDPDGVCGFNPYPRRLEGLIIYRLVWNSRQHLSLLTFKVLSPTQNQTKSLALGPPK